MNIDKSGLFHIFGKIFPLTIYQGVENFLHTVFVVFKHFS